MAIANPIFPFPSAGSAFNTGVRKVSIMAAVAVLLRNMEKTAVTRMNPNSTYRDCVPKGLSITRANNTSSPLLVAAMARINPPINSMMIGSAKQCRIDLYLTVCPNSSAGVFWVKNHKLLSETVSNNSTTIRTEVVHAGTASNTHMSVAKMKMEISLCSITVNPSIPKVSMGRNHKIRERVIAMVNFIHRATV